MCLKIRCNVFRKKIWELNEAICMICLFEDLLLDLAVDFVVINMGWNGRMGYSLRQKKKTNPAFRAQHLTVRLI